MRLIFYALISATILYTGCGRGDQTPAISNPATAVVPVVPPKADAIDAQLGTLVKSHAALTFPNAGLGTDGARKTLDYQEIIDGLHGKSVGFVALLDDVYRTKDGYRAVFGPFELGFDAVFVLTASEEDARRLNKFAHEDGTTTYAVIAQIESMKVNYQPARHVKGEKGEDPDSMDVDEFGLQISRVINGKLIASERERH